MRTFRFLLPLLICVVLSACSPSFDWREVRGSDVPFSALMPAKPSSQTRPVVLNGTQVQMSMTVAQAENLTFAVGAAQFATPADALAALDAMRTALVRNIDGKVVREKSGLTGLPPAATEIEAISQAKGTSAPEKRLAARFVAKDTHAYQVVVVGAGKLPEEAVDTFLTSFKPE